MLIPPGPIRVLVATKPVDFRKGMDGLGIHPVGAAGMALSELTAPSRQAARASGIGLRQFHGSSAARSVILWSAILASTSASQAWGSTSLSLAV